MKKEKGIILKFGFTKDDLKDIKMPSDLATKVTPLKRVAEDALETGKYGGPIIGENIIIGHNTYSLIIAACVKAAVSQHMKHLCNSGDLEEQIESIVKAFSHSEDGKHKKVFDAAEKYYNFLDEYAEAMVVKGVAIDREAAELFPNIVSDDIIDFFKEQSGEEGDKEFNFFVLQSGSKHVEATVQDGKDWLRELEGLVAAEVEGDELLYGE
jgi:hypothetical protein